MARPGPARGQLLVGRYLGALSLLLVLLYLGVFLGGPGSSPLTPKLGLDLQGGASVILSPKTEAGRAPRQDQLNTAVDIINRRVNGLGVAEAEVVTQGPNIVVSVPGGTQGSLAALATTAQLRFREVLQQAASTSAPQPTNRPATSPSATPSTTTSQLPVVKPSTQASAKPTATTNGRAVPPALVAAPTPTPAVSAKPSARPTPTPTPTGTGAPATDAASTPKSGDPYTPQAFALLDCASAAARKGGVNDQPDQPILACSDDGAVKYHLDKAAVIGTDVKGANASLDNNSIAWVVNVQFTGKGQNKWTDLTARTVGKNVGVVLDGLVLSAPVIQQRIAGDAQISGSFTQKSATALANTLKYGALPLTFERSETMVVSPTLGKDQLHSGLLAGGLGLVAVVIYCLLYYRALGFVTIASLLVSGALTYAFIALLGKQIGFALSLAGIAGFIVAVGITADSFVVFFERLKDEIREGRTPRSAVDRAWVRARRTIISADSVSFLAAIILYFFSVGGVRGFAFTLGLSTLLDVVVVFLFTRPLISWLARFGWFSRTGPTGFIGPDGGQPFRGAAPSLRRGAAASAATAAAKTSEA